MARTKGIKVAILMFVMIALVIGYYYYLSYRNEQANSAEAQEDMVEIEMTPVQELLARADYREYPTTPAQVLKYYNEITACFYNEEYTEEELEELALLASSLYDAELIANQTWDSYMKNLKDDIEVFKAGNIRIYHSEVTPAMDVEYFTQNGYECARLYCVYTLQSGTMFQSSKQVFILRKDEDQHWKIFGFELVETD